MIRIMVFWSKMSSMRLSVLDYPCLLPLNHGQYLGALVVLNRFVGEGKENPTDVKAMWTICNFNLFGLRQWAPQSSGRHKGK